MKKTPKMTQLQESEIHLSAMEMQLKRANKLWDKASAKFHTEAHLRVETFERLLQFAEDKYYCLFLIHHLQRFYNTIKTEIRPDDAERTIKMYNNFPAGSQGNEKYLEAQKREQLLDQIQREELDALKETIKASFMAWFGIVEEEPGEDDDDDFEEVETD